MFCWLSQLKARTQPLYNNFSESTLLFISRCSSKDLYACRSGLQRCLDYRGALFHNEVLVKCDLGGEASLKEVGCWGCGPTPLPLCFLLPHCKLFLLCCVLCHATPPCSGANFLTVSFTLFLRRNTQHSKWRKKMFI